MNSDCNLLVELALLGRFIEIPEYLSFLRRLPEKSLPARDSWHALQMQQDFFDPSIRSKLALWLSSRRRPLEYAVSVVRAPLPARQKLEQISADLLGGRLKRVMRAAGGQPAHPSA
ncbi:MAG: hypothetical protein C4289_02910 [Chloroflexota bacterium]